MNALYDYAGAIVRAVYRARFDGPPVLNAMAYFPNAIQFTSEWRALRDEALALAARRSLPRFEEIMPEQAEISAVDQRDWRVFMPKAYGQEFPENMVECPILADLLRRTPEVISATFSYLAPHKRIPPHRGPFRGIMRFHLGLAMPLDSDGRPATILTIDNREHRFGDGECLLWDDTYPHEVWNNSDQPRVALLLDVWRPGMPRDLEFLSRIIVRGVRLAMRWRGFRGGGA
jgi:aspartate beta-hydroxylase